MYDIAVLTDGRYVAPDDNDWYIRQIHQEDGLVADALRRQGLSVVRRDWADPDVDWSDCRALLFRTTWDYFDRFAEFSPWLEQVSGQCRLFNEAALIRWNIDKHYLGDLAAAGASRQEDLQAAQAQLKVTQARIDMYQAQILQAQASLGLGFLIFTGYCSFFS
jgi:hypothetical protein